MDYRLWCVLALLAWGAWGFLSKFVSRDMPTPALVFWVNLAGLVPVAIYVVSQRGIVWHRSAGLATIAGLLGSGATIAFYLALARGPASVVLPFTAMYVLIPALLGYIFLREPVTLAHAAGLVCAGAAIVLLTR